MNPTPFHFDEDNINEDVMEKKIYENFELKEKKINYSELISVNIFGLIFAFVFFNILSNFFRND